jgi:hypothetical protein
VNIAKQRLRTDGAGQREHLVQASQVYFARHRRMLQDRFHFGSENEETVRSSRMEKRADAELISREK